MTHGHTSLVSVQRDRERDRIVAMCDRQIFSHYKHMPFFFNYKNPFFQETSLVLCDDLEGWDAGGKGGNICIIMADSHCCTAETNTFLKIAFFKKRKKTLIKRPALKIAGTLK